MHTCWALSAESLSTSSIPSFFSQRVRLSCAWNSRKLSAWREHDRQDDRRHEGLLLLPLLVTATAAPVQRLLTHSHTRHAKDLLDRRLGIFELGREPRDACASLAELHFKVSGVLGCGVCLCLEVILVSVVARGLHLRCVAMMHIIKVIPTHSQSNGRHVLRARTRAHTNTHVKCMRD